MRVDVIIIGAGPAGLSVAAACGRAGLSVTIVAPDLVDPWPNRYGVFSDDTLVDVPSSVSFAETMVRIGDQWTAIPRQYVRVDQEALKTQFLRVCSEKGIAALHGKVERIVSHRSHLRVHWAGDEIYAKAVIDASGHRSEFTDRAEDPYYFQTALGWLIETDRPPVDHDCVMMDWKPAPGVSSNDQPTFLYAMKYGEQQYFLEETVLIGTEVADFEMLEQRLRARIGHDEFAIVETEKCVIPMTGGLPKPDNSVIAFGGAASMVHPATGYLLSNVLNRAPGLANKIKTNLHLHSDELAKTVNDFVWSDDARKRYALMQFGGAYIAQSSAEDTWRFFDTFFRMETERWSPYMRGDLSSAETSKFMLEMFSKAGLSTKAKLVAESFKNPKKLLDGLF